MFAVLKNASVKGIFAARSTETAADSYANAEEIINDDERHIFSMLGICNKLNKLFFKKAEFFYPMNMLAFSPPPSIAAHLKDIHLGALSTPTCCNPHAYLLSDLFPTPRLLSPPSFYSEPKCPVSLWFIF